MTLDDAELELMPARFTVDDMTVSARVRRLDGVWEVVVMFSRLPGRQALASADVQVQLVTHASGTMELVSAPVGDALPEVGGGLGNTASARYEFGNGLARPAQLIVRYRSSECSFGLLQRPT